MQGRKRCLCSCLFKVKWFKGKKGAKDVFVHASDKNMGTPKGKVKWFNFAKVSSNVTTVCTLKGKVKWFNFAKVSLNVTTVRLGEGLFCSC